MSNQEIGERLRLLLSKGRAEVPPHLRELVHSFSDDEEQPPKIRIRLRRSLRREGWEGLT
jgi:hypothetical protein